MKQAAVQYQYKYIFVPIKAFGIMKHAAPTTIQQKLASPLNQNQLARRQITIHRPPHTDCYLFTAGGLIPGPAGVDELRAAVLLLPAVLFLRGITTLLLLIRWLTADRRDMTSDRWC